MNGFFAPLITSLTLTDFRSYAAATLPIAAGSVVLHGPNGAGKTNLLEALSLFTPGKGLRGATAPEMGRREPGEATGRAWAVAAVLTHGDDETKLGTGVQTARRRAPHRPHRRRDGPARPAARPPAPRLGHARAGPAVLRRPRRPAALFRPAGVRRRPDPTPPRSPAYEKALRERLRLLTEGAEGRAADPLWLDALEIRLGEAGAAAALARAAALTTLQSAIDARSDRPFPQADLGLTGEAETQAAEGADETAIAAVIRDGMVRSRARDAAAGRSLYGPHRSDLTALHREKNRPAAEGSSGEQKALVLNLILAQIARLADQACSPRPAARRGPRPPRHGPPRRPVRRDRGAGPAGLHDRDGGGAVRPVCAAGRSSFGSRTAGSRNRGLRARCSVSGNPHLRWEAVRPRLWAENLHRFASPPPHLRFANREETVDVRRPASSAAFPRNSGPESPIGVFRPRASARIGFAS
jgi:DNA replication and repair protein RecF